MTQQDSTGKSPIHEAHSRTRDVRDGLEVAGAELDLAHSILERELPPEHKIGDVRKAIDRNGAVAADVAEAKEELAEVEALLEQEMQERERLEREIGRRP